MCNIYKGENYIPRNRPGVYEKCALMLFDRWDRSRRIDVPFSFEEQLSPVMKHIAYWIFSKQELHAGVTESQLILEAATYLHGRTEESIDKAEKTAREFIEFCRGRAWIFRDTGTTADGEPLYQFTHRTFLEYFTAAQLVRTHATPAELAAELLPRVSKKEWDIVAQLAFQLQNNNLEGAADKLFGALLTHANSGVSESNKKALLGFAIRCLGFINPRPSVVREVTAEALNLCVRSVSERLPSIDKERTFGYRDYEASEIINNLLVTAPGNRSIVADVVKTELSNKIHNSELAEACGAFDIARSLGSPVEMRTGENRIEEWNSISIAILGSQRDKIRAMAEDVGDVARCAYLNGLVSAAEIVQWHDLSELFKPIRSLTFNALYFPVVDLLFRGAQLSGKDDAGERFAQIGRFLASSNPPWVRTRNLGGFHRLRFPKHQYVQAAEESVDALYGIFCCLAVLLESGEKRGSLPDVLSFVRKSKNPQILSVKDLLLLRYDTSSADSMAEIIAKKGFDHKQIEQLLGWATRKLNFVDRTKRSDKKSIACLYCRA